MRYIGLEMCKIVYQKPMEDSLPEQRRGSGSGNASENWLGELKWAVDLGTRKSGRACPGIAEYYIY